MVYRRLLLGVGLSLLLASMAQGQTVVNLTYEPDSLGQAITPARAGVVVPIEVRMAGASGTVSLFGQEIKIAGQMGREPMFGLDCDGDGQISAGEYRPTASTKGTIGFAVQVGTDSKKKYSLLLNDTRLTVKNNAVTSATAVCLANGCMKGVVNGQTIRLADENLDGRFTQDGKDSIIIGDNLVGMPLRKLHQIGGQHYQLDVAEDGTKVTLTAVEKPELGQVEVPIKAGLACLIVSDGKDKVYDLKTAGKGIPAGDYRLVYGALRNGGQFVIMKPSSGAVTYSIAAGQNNKIQIGEPLRVEFAARFTTGATNSTVMVSPPVTVLGTGNEVYDLAYASGVGRPTVVISEGERMLSSASMEFG